MSFALLVKQKKTVHGSTYTHTNRKIDQSRQE